MLSQLTKTIKMALRSTEEERAILRARSAVQRFPVVEWRQRMEDLHKRSINMSRSIAGAESWRESDCDGAGLLPMQDAEDWNPEALAYPSQPDWDSRSINEGRMSMPATPGSPGQWSQDSLTPAGDPYLSAPRVVYDGHRGSFETTTDGGDYFAQPRAAPDSPQGYNSFLDKANRVISRNQKNAPDPFLDPSAVLMPNRPFGAHSRVSSVESISSIVDEKSNSPLNKAMASVSHITSCWYHMLTNVCIKVHRRQWRGCVRFRSETTNA